MIYVITEIDEDRMWIASLASQWFDRFDIVDVQLLKLFDQDDIKIDRNVFDRITHGRCQNLRDVVQLKWKHHLFMLDRLTPRRYVTLMYV